VWQIEDKISCYGGCASPTEAKSGTSSQGKKKAVSQVTGPVRSALAGADKMKVLINKEAQSSRSSKAVDVVHPC
jgi:hypothetical protein